MSIRCWLGVLVSLLAQPGLLILLVSLCYGVYRLSTYTIDETPVREWYGHQGIPGYYPSTGPMHDDRTGDAPVGFNTPSKAKPAPLEIEQRGSVLVAKTPTALQPSDVPLFLDLVLSRVDARTTEVRLCRGESSVIDRLGLEARNRGFDPRWQSDRSYELGAWVLRCDSRSSR